MKYQGNNPKRRIATWGYFTARELAAFAGQARYVGSALHKTKPANYGLSPPTSPRPSKSLCDSVRVVPKAEAKKLLASGFAKGLVSSHRQGRLNLPKFVWAVDDAGEVYEAKLGADGKNYHGYRLGYDEKSMRKWVKREWNNRAN